MAPSARVKAAFDAMKNIGIPEKKTKPALKKLLALFEKKWDLIEEENYRLLADTIFEFEDTEAAEKEKKQMLPSTDQGVGVEEENHLHDEPERPLKRLRKAAQTAPSNGQTSPSSGTFALKIPKPEPGEPEMSLGEQVLPQSVSPQSLVRNKGKQPISHQNTGIVIERSQPSAPPHVRDRMKDSATPHAAQNDKRASHERASHALVDTRKQKRPDTTALIKVKDEPFTEDMLLEPLAVVPPKRSQARSSLSNPLDKPGAQLPGASKPVDGVDKVASQTTKKNPLEEAEALAVAPANIDIAASPLGEVKVCLSCPGPNSHDFHVPDIQAVLKKVEDNCFKTYKVMNPEFTVTKFMRELCECVLELGKKRDDVAEERKEDAGVVDNKETAGSSSLNASINPKSSDTGAAPTDTSTIDASIPPSASNSQPDCMKFDKCATDMDLNVKSLVVVREDQHQLLDSRCLYDMSDITRGIEEAKVSLEKSNCEFLPSFHYVAQNVVSHTAQVIFSLAQIGDQDCCASCDGDCLSSSASCNCAQRNGGGPSPYTSDGLVREDYLEECISVVQNPQKHSLMYCKECPLERLKNEDMLDPCKGHLKRKFIKECWTKCDCSKHCGNRVLQRGITHSLQVFWTPEGKGWGLRTLVDLPKGAFVCEYVGEILTITELHKRNARRTNDKRSYSVLLDTDWGSRTLRREEVLCLDAAYYGNVARFINHRCSDANLIEIPVEVETPNHHYYHVALFTTRKVDAFEELTWDYGVDFDDNELHIKAFRCQCGSKFCRNMTRSSRSRSALALQ